MLCRGCAGGVQGVILTSKHQKITKTLTKQVQNRSEWTQNTFLGQNCGLGGLKMSKFCHFFDFFSKIGQNGLFCQNGQNGRFSPFFPLFSYFWVSQGPIFGSEYPKNPFWGCFPPGVYPETRKNGQNNKMDKIPIHGEVRLCK